MKTKFQYQKEKDIWCLLNKGKSSNHSKNSTKQYDQLLEKYGENPTPEIVEEFIESYVLEKNISIEKYTNLYQNDWDKVSEEYHRRAQEIFGIKLPSDVMAYLTINSRCPYSIEENYFFVTVPTYDYIARKTTMHELWHFYTWYRFGVDQVEKLGVKKYEDLKEALTVLLNAEYKDLLPENVIDAGYPQHTDLRDKILDYWKKDRNITNLWNYISHE